MICESTHLFSLPINYQSVHPTQSFITPFTQTSIHPLFCPTFCLSPHYVHHSSIYLPTVPINLPIYPSSHPSSFLSTTVYPCTTYSSPSISLTTYPSICPSSRLSILPSIHSPIYPSSHLSIHSSIHPSHCSHVKPHCYSLGTSISWCQDYSQWKRKPTSGISTYRGRVASAAPLPLYLTVSEQSLHKTCVVCKGIRILCASTIAESQSCSFVSFHQGKRGIVKPPFDLPDFIKVQCFCGV